MARLNIVITFGENKSDAIFSSFNVIPACDRQTDGQTDGHLASCDSIVRAMHGISRHTPVLR